MTSSTDALRRPVSTVAGSDIIQYTYTQTGQIRTEQANKQRTTYTYNALGQVINVAEKETPAPGAVFTVTLDANGGTASPATVQAVFRGMY